jgi:hypothetical protein
MVWYGMVDLTIQYPIPQYAYLTEGVVWKEVALPKVGSGSRLVLYGMEDLT